MVMGMGQARMSTKGRGASWTTEPSGDHPNYDLLKGCRGVCPQATERPQYLQTPHLPPVMSRGFDQTTWPAEKEALWCVLVSPVPPVSYNAEILPPNIGIRRQYGQSTHRQGLPRVPASGTRDNRDAAMIQCVWTMQGQHQAWGGVVQP